MSDLIDRQAVYDAITEIDCGINMDIYTDEVRKIIDDLPSVTPTERTGHWVAEWFDADGEERHYCSECCKWEYTESDYCPNCGAKMQESDNCN